MKKEILYKAKNDDNQLVGVVLKCGKDCFCAEVFSDSEMFDYYEDLFCKSLDEAIAFIDYQLYQNDANYANFSAKHGKSCKNNFSVNKNLVEMAKNFETFEDFNDYAYTKGYFDMDEIGGSWQFAKGSNSNFDLQDECMSPKQDGARVCNEIGSNIKYAIDEDYIYCWKFDENGKLFFYEKIYKKENCLMSYIHFDRNNDYKIDEFFEYILKDSKDFAIDLSSSYDVTFHNGELSVFSHETKEWIESCDVESDLSSSNSSVNDDIANEAIEIGAVFFVELRQQIDNKFPNKKEVEKRLKKGGYNEDFGLDLRVRDELQHGLDELWDKYHFSITEKVNKTAKKLEFLFFN